LRDNKNYQTMQAHLAAFGTASAPKAVKTSKVKQDISEFI
jgi:hypothetical protein